MASPLADLRTYVGGHHKATRPRSAFLSRTSTIERGASLSSLPPKSPPGAGKREPVGGTGTPVEGRNQKRRERRRVKGGGEDIWGCGSRGKENVLVF